MPSHPLAIEEGLLLSTQTSNRKVCVGLALFASISVDEGKGP